MRLVCGRVRNWQEAARLPFHEIDHVDDARRADHGLVGEDGSHGLLDAELGLQGRQERLNLLPGNTENMDLKLCPGIWRVGGGDYSLVAVCRPFSLKILY